MCLPPLDRSQCLIAGKVFLIVATAAYPCLLIAVGTAVRIQCPGVGVPPSTLFVWMEESVGLFLFSIVAERKKKVFMASLKPLTCLE